MEKPISKRYMLVGKESIYAAVWGMANSFIGKVDAEFTSLKAPIPEGPAVLSRHIKHSGYFWGGEL